MATAAAVATSAVLPVFLVGALAVQVRADLGFTASGLGMTVAAFFGAASLGSTPGGRIAERLGPAAAMRVAAGLAALSLALLAVCGSFLALLGCLVVGGLSNALAQPATNLFLARRIDPSRLGFAFGIKQSAIPAATLLGGLAVPTVALTVGWRWAFAGAAAVVAVVAVAGPGGGARAPAIARGARRAPSDAALRSLALLAVGAGLGAAAAGTLGSFLVSGAVDAGISEGSAGLLSSACSAAGLTTRVLAGARADRRGGRHLSTVSVMLGAGTAGYACLATGVEALVVAGGVLGFCLGWGWPGLFNLAVVRANPGAPGAATGITQTGTYFGGVAGPLLFGVVADGLSYRAAWLAAGGCSLAAAAMVAAGRRRLVGDQARREAGALS
jgi:MFS family permease